MGFDSHENGNLWKLNLDVVHKRTKKVIWQPRIGCWYDDRIFSGDGLPGRYHGMSMSELYKALGVSNRCYMYNSCIKEVLDPRIHIEREDISPMEYRETMYTPKGNLTQIVRKNTSNPGSYPLKWWISTEEDMIIHRWVLENSTWEWDQKLYDELKAEWEFAGAPQAWLSRVNVQYLFHNVMGVEPGIYAIYDYPETVEGYFEALKDNQDRMIDVFNLSPIEIVNYGDNVHCGLLPPELFKKYVLPMYNYRNDRLHKYGKFTNAHWDGDVKALLPYVHDTGLDGIEAVTPLPQGDVTLEEVKKAFGDDVFLLDGIAAILFDPLLYPIEALEDQTRKCLELFGGQLVLGISDELASRGDVDRIIRVKEIVDEYNSKVE